MTTETIKLPGANFVIGDAEGAEAHIKQRADKLGRSCGSCSLCCKILDIPELDKPSGRWCSHCKPGKGGCEIYSDRPLVCRAFGCQWLADGSFGDHWYPVCSRMVLRMLPNSQEGSSPLRLHVNVDTAYRGAWRAEPYWSDLRDRATRMQVIVYEGDRMFAVYPDKAIEFTKGMTIIRPTPGGPHIVVPNEKAEELMKAAKTVVDYLTNPCSPRIAFKG